MKENEFIFKGKRIPISTTDSPQQYKTRLYFKTMKALEKNQIKKKSFEEAINWFFYEDQEIPSWDKEGIDEIIRCDEIDIIVLRMEDSKSTFKKLNYLTQNTGWYFYLTGIVLPRSIISDYVDRIPRLNFDFTKWDFKDKAELKLESICLKPGMNCFLLKIGEKAILLDAGLSHKDIENLKNKLPSLDLIFLSHAHYDHCCGLVSLIEKYPDTPVICSKTTSDIFVFNSTVSGFFNNDKIQLPQNIIRVVKNVITVENKEKISFKNGFIQFFHAGHMPGSLMFFVEFNNFRFLYTGDFSYYTYFPITGVKQIIRDLPRHTDFILLDGSSAHLKYLAPQYIINKLKVVLKKKAIYNNQVLIVADPASVAIVLYLKIFHYFRSLQTKKDFQKRPTIFLNRKILEFIKIIQTRKEDLHPVIKEDINKGLNPFSSALIRWVLGWSDIEKAIQTKRSIIIFDPPDLTGKAIQTILLELGIEKYNLIYLSGALRTRNAIELASGNKNIIVEGCNYKINAEIFNFENPSEIINLHADFLQIEKMLRALKPKKVCLFHQKPRLLTNARLELKKLPFIEETLVFHDKNEVITLNSINSLSKDTSIKKSKLDYPGN
ncbi:MAG: MBL fold metallo-hydrolase [Candidatus Freyarchaeum deiterrae]